VTREVHWSGTAGEHIIAITEYIARTSPVYAEWWVDRILSRRPAFNVSPFRGAEPMTGIRPPSSRLAAGG
jgi:hypothetical protein